MIYWTELSNRLPRENEHVLLKMTHKETEEKHYTVGYIRDGMFKSRGISPCDGLDDESYYFQWVYLYEIENLIESEWADVGPLGLVHGDW